MYLQYLFFFQFHNELYICLLLLVSDTAYTYKTS